MPLTDQKKAPATASSDAATQATDVEPAPGTQQAAGAAAVSRIANASDGGGGSGLSFHQALIEMLGPLASIFDFDKIPAVLAQKAKEVANDVAAVSSSSSSASAPPPASGDKAPSAAANKEPHETGVAGLVQTVRDTIENDLATKGQGLLALLPGGAELGKKIGAYAGEHPVLVDEVLLLAAVADYFSNQKIPTLSKTLDLGDTLSAKGTVDLGTIQKIALQSVGASIAYHKDKLSATAGINHTFTGTGATTFSLDVSEKDWTLLGQKIDESMQSYKHTETGGKPPTDVIMGSIAFHLDSVGFKFKDSATDAAVKAKTVTPSTPRAWTNTMSEGVTSPTFKAFGAEGWQVEGDATESMGTGHKPNTVGGKLTLPKMGDYTVSASETVPYGPNLGTTKPQFSVDVAWKGITVTVGQGAIASSDYSAPIGGSSSGWHVGIKIPFGGGKSKD